jgi:hypothetical protein
MQAFSQFLDRVSGYLASRKGLLPTIGISLILLNFVFRLFPLGWVTTTDLFLHLGIILALIGLMLAWAL